MLVVLGLLLAAAAAGEPKVLRHDIEIALDPAAAGFASVDRLEVEGPGELSLPAVEGVTCEADAPLSVPPGPHRLTLRFRGTLRGAAKEEMETYAPGDSTPGRIGPDGSVLLRGFYAATEMLSLFRLSIRVPLPHRAVSQGRRVEEREEAGEYRVVYEGGYPVAGIAVVAGPWIVDERTIGGAPCRTYLHERERGYAGLLLSALEQEVPRYRGLFGALPDGRFDLVESPFARGRDFPQFALLGAGELQSLDVRADPTGGGALPSRRLERALARCWLGNFLQCDDARGSWCGALATYYANCSAAEREGRGPEYRRAIANAYSLHVSPGAECPLAQCREGTGDLQRCAGDGKGAMVFHMLAREVGREALDLALRKVVERRGGTRLGWEDLAAEIGEALGRDLRGWFAPWICRAGAPVLQIGELRYDGTRIEGTIRQDQEGPAYELRIPVRVETAAGDEEQVVASASRETAFRIDVKAAPTRILLDPGYDLFRRIPRRQVAPCLDGVLTAPVRAGYGDAGTLALLGLAAAGATPPADAAIFSLGLPPDADPIDLARIDLAIEKGAFRWRGTRYDRPADAILVSYRTGSGGLVSMFHGNGPLTAALHGDLGLHRAEGWVLFRDGRAEKSGDFDGDGGACAEFSEARRGAAEPLVRDLLWLTSPEHAGRRPGTAEAYNLANALRGRMVKMGLKVPAWPPVEVLQGFLGETRRIRLAGGGTIENAFYPFHRSASVSRPVEFARVLMHPVEEVKDALVLLREEAGDTAAEGYAARGAAAVAVIAGDAAYTARAREAAWPRALPPAAAAEVVSRGGDADAAPTAWMARAGGPPLPIPYLYLSAEAAARLLQAGTGGALEFELARAAITTSNVVGVVGEAGERGILLGAHWDGAGTIRGAAAEGAADGSAGVAIVLWVAEQLRRDAEAGRLKRPVVVALFGAGETGLWGSRQFAALVRSGKAPVPPPLAAVNVDAVGNRADAEVACIGRSFAPRLLARFAQSLEGTGLTLGRDDDAVAFAEGSDHWPLHLAKIPAVTLRSFRDGAGGPLADRREYVDVGTMRRVAQAVYRMVRGMAEAETLEVP